MNADACLYCTGSLASLCIQSEPALTVQQTESHLAFPQPCELGELGMLLASGIDTRDQGFLVHADDMSLRNPTEFHEDIMSRKPPFYNFKLIKTLDNYVSVWDLDRTKPLISPVHS